MGWYRLTTHENAIITLLPLLKDRTQREFINQLVILAPRRSRWICTGEPDGDLSQAKARLTAFTVQIVPVLNEYLPK